MQNIKYHTLNIIAIMLFAYFLASTINQVVKYNISPVYSAVVRSARKKPIRRGMKSFDSYNLIKESGIFKIADPNENTTGEGPNAAGSLDELTLLGTITGPRSIARAMIRKRGEKNPGIFSLYKINNDVTNNVYGYKLIAIYGSKIYLDVSGERVALELFAKKSIGPSGAYKKGKTSGASRFKRTLSRAEIKQKVFNNMDNALRGLTAGPYRVNGVIKGYRLRRVRPYNILYKFGARSGDIVKRVNGREINSTKKLYSMWEILKTESRITVDIERGGRVITYDFSITQ